MNRAFLWAGRLWCLASVGCSNGSGGGDGGMAAADSGGRGGSSSGTTGSSSGRSSSSGGMTASSGGGPDGSSSGGMPASSGGGPDGSSSGTTSGAMSLIGTWDIMTTPTGSTRSLTTTVAIGQNSLTVNAPDFVLSATRTTNTLTFTDEQTIGNPSNNVVLTAAQTAATFNAGILPFDLGGSWTIQIGRPGQSADETCMLAVSSTEIDGACHGVSRPLIDFSFTTKKMTFASSSLGDFGGTWMNTWTWPGASGGAYPCLLTFTGNTITTCSGGAMNGAVSGTPLSGITFTYDGANTASGAAQGWAEYSATRQ